MSLVLCTTGAKIAQEEPSVSQEEYNFKGYYTSKSQSPNKSFAIHTSSIVKPFVSKSLGISGFCIEYAVTGYSYVNFEAGVE